MLGATLQSINVDGVGAAQFNGVLYTHGHIYSADQIRIVGAMLAQDDGSQPRHENIADHDLRPGDLLLGEQTAIHYVPGIENQIAQALGLLGVMSWIQH